MSIFYICGKPGGGKSYLGVQQIIHELCDVSSNRFIVTNIELNLVEIASWLHDNCKHEVNLTERVRILDDAEAGDFWLYEPHREFTRRKTVELKRRSYEIPDFEDRAERGTLYVIDEVHNYFGARDWQNTGSDCTFFLTQHRKLLCDVVFITQHPEQTDKALRRLAQEYMTVRNLSREPILGFNLASWFGTFRFVRSLNSPQSPNPAVIETGFVDLKPEVIGKFYNTMSGVGIAGRVVPTNKPRGRSLYWLFLPIGILAFCGYLVFTHVGDINKALSHAMKSMFFKAGDSLSGSIGLTVPTNKPPQNEPPAQPAALPSDGADNPLPQPFRKRTNQQTNEIYCVGYTVLGGYAQVSFSDGSYVTSEDGVIEQIQKGFVIVSGKKYKVRQAKMQEYVPHDVVTYPQPVFIEPPVNQADVTVIGQSYKNRTSPPRLNGFNTMSKNNQGSQNGNLSNNF